ncbi:MAG: hypothetical protein R2730_10790 [Chitinophagales bacterium]
MTNNIEFLKEPIEKINYVKYCHNKIENTFNKTKLDFNNKIYFNKTESGISDESYSTFWEIYLSIIDKLMDKLKHQIELLEGVHNNNNDLKMGSNQGEKIKTNLSIPEIGYLFGILSREGIITSKYSKDISEFISDKFITQYTDDPSWKSINKNFASPENSFTYDKVYDLLVSLSNRVRKEKTKSKNR